VPIQTAQRWFPGLAFPMPKNQIIFQIKHTKAILSNSTRKLLQFEFTKMLIAVLEKKFYCVIYYNFWHIFVHYPQRAVVIHKHARISTSEASWYKSWSGNKQMVATDCSTLPANA